MNKKDAYAVYCERLNAVNVLRREAGMDISEPLSLRQFYRRCKERLDESAEALLSGKRSASSRFQTSGKPFEANFPGEVGLLDFTQIDLIARDPQTGLAVGKIWLGAIMDVYSRAIVAWTLSFNPPGLEALSCLMRQLVRGWRNAPSGINGDVEPFVPPPGLFRTLVTDNAWENVGRSFHRTCAHHNIDLHHTAVAHSQGKSPIERAFGTFNSDLWHGLPGGKPFTTYERNKREIDPERTARLYIDEVVAEFANYLSCEYHQRVHSGLGCSPKTAWLTGGAQFPPVLPASIELYEASLGVEVDRVLDPRGIRLHGLNFNGPIVSQLLNDLLPTAPGAAGKRSVSVTVRYLQDDLSKVFVLNTKNNAFMAVPRVEDGLPRHMGIYTLDELKAAADAEQDQEVPIEVLRKVAATRTERIERMRRDRKLQVRSRAQRLANDVAASTPKVEAGRRNHQDRLVRSEADALTGLFAKRVRSRRGASEQMESTLSQDQSPQPDEVMTLFSRRKDGGPNAS